MTLHENFDILKRELEGLGYRSPGLDDHLRAQLASGKDNFKVSHREDSERLSLHVWFNISRDRQSLPLKLDDYDTLLLENRDKILARRSFTGEVSKQEAREVLAKDAIYPSSDMDMSLWVLRNAAVREYLHEGHPAHIDY